MNEVVYIENGLVKYEDYKEILDQLEGKVRNCKLKDKEIERQSKMLINRDKEFLKLNDEIERLNNIIEEVRKYLTSYESIETIQQCEHPESNKGLDEKTMIEMCRRYLIVHDKILNILELKEDK